MCFGNASEVCWMCFGFGSVLDVFWLCLACVLEVWFHSSIPSGMVGTRLIRGDKPRAHPHAVAAHSQRRRQAPSVEDAA